MDKRLTQPDTKQAFPRRKQNRRWSIAGLTLAEVLVVMFVIGALMVMAAPKYINIIERQRAQESVQMLLALLNSQKRYQLDNGVYAPNLGSLDIVVTDYSTDAFNLPVADNTDNAVGLTPGLAQIQRTDLTYTLWINQNGQIGCIPAGVKCTNLGY